MTLCHTLLDSGSVPLCRHAALEGYIARRASRPRGLALRRRRDGVLQYVAAWRRPRRGRVLRGAAS